ncbi:MAG: biotin/lipoyl-binding protein, partial [Syntrophomonadaceae bacterium]|nr:biotin/lipoyl-binding protein [Syntrophomonadaceae bacterium]
PLPGTILAVNVNPGVAVKQGDVLFILEAMKMETEIKAPRDGVIAQIMVVKGASVATGDILLALQ